MSINQIPQTSEERLLQRIIDLEKAVEQLKFNQAPSNIGNLITIDQTTGDIIISDGVNDRIIIGKLS